MKGGIAAHIFNFKSGWR